MPNPIQTLSDLTKNGFKPLSEKKTKHYAAIGRLIMIVSNELDSKLNMLLQTMIGGDESASRAIVGEMRIPDIIAAIRRIATARSLGKDTVKHMESVFAEITPLRQARDIIAHKAIWVKGNKMAFHNAQVAKTDSAIEVLYYTIDELNDFSRYARRLGYRVQLLMPGLVPIPRTPAQNAFVTLLTQHLITLGAGAALKQPSITKAKALELKEASSISHAAVKALTEIAKQIDPKLHEAQRAASEAIIKFATVVTQLDAPELPSLLEMPARLRPNSQNRETVRLRTRRRPVGSFGI